MAHQTRERGNVLSKVNTAKKVQDKEKNPNYIAVHDTLQWILVNTYRQL